ncbi:T9SS type A sorting domain-containing protein [Neolewinella aurantiaca]|uniref:T9SS type A sorting domain-containing protein n=1 Tax=Neolewinella aurantiaca TaxID=2602767 RepID=A0A5C7FDJ0_9BACT|nr:zinc-dependent metalloprotease family protein [Neolewinella aurantiaca]TXF88260.1 T9SS type A sorting domain-containing protein [Neolewinella aurantiaca]
MIRLLSLALALCVTLGLTAQTSPFQFTGSVAVTSEIQDVKTVSVDLDLLRDELKQAPLEFQGLKSKTVVSLPLPGGGFAEFTAYNSPMADDPELGSYRLVGPWGGGRVATSPNKMSAVVRGPNGYFVIDPIEDNSGNYRVSNYSEFMAMAAEDEGEMSCGYDDVNMPDYADLELSEEMLERGAHAGAHNGLKAGNEARELRVYDLIITNTGEFADRVGGTKAAVREAYNTVVSTINAIFENEVGIRMQLTIVDTLIYLDAASDPYINPDQEGGRLLGQVLPAFTAAGIPLGSYDLGHILTGRCSDVGGVVSGNACNDGGKTRGVTCVGGTVVAAALRIMAHEVAHQFSVSHSWNNCPGNDGQRASGTAFEPGSGTTIMSYAGACGSQNIGGEQSYYHVGSLEQFLTFTRETGAADCATVIETDNFTPEVDFDYEDDFTIPVSTPFRLTGTATDANGDALTYTWEQYDLGPASDINNPSGNAPLFRSFFPVPDGNVRYFPTLNRIVNDIQDNEEVLPTYTREMTFRLTARDNNPMAGGVDWKQLHFFTSDVAGPFLVDDIAGGDLHVGDYREITWDVANTDQAPVNCKRVNIVMSTDGGETFDIVLAEDAPNIGSAFITVPEEALTSSGRIMVEAADNVFLNVNTSEFNVLPAEVPSFTLEPSTRFEEVCLPDVLSIELNTGSILNFAAPIALSIDTENLPDGAVAEFSDDILVPGVDGTLTVDLSDVRYSGPLEVVVVAVAEGQDTARRTILFDVTDNDYSDLATTAPAEGTTGVILATTFNWTDAVNADTYEIEIATSPTFSEESIFERSSGLTSTNYLPAEFFDSNTLYFWRIRPTNVCGAGEWTDPNSFRTVNSSCTPYKTEDDVNLPGSGPSYVRTSALFIEESGAISDVNLPNVDVRYNFVSKLTLTLISPAGTRVVLYDEKCFSTNRLDLGFDDDAPVAVACPPDDERVFIPEGSLADFNGEDIFGEWLLEVAVSETGNGAGSIISWDIEFCADVSASNLSRINNTATEVEPLGRSVVLKEKLSVTSDQYNSGDVMYTLTALPEFGNLELYGNVLQVGDSFSQADINGLGLFYESADADADTDDFGYVVTTPDGGYLAVAYHDVLIFDGAIVSNREVSALEAGLSVFPNPVANDLSIRWDVAINRNIDLELFDMNGRLLQSSRVDGAAKAATLNTSALPSGVYLLRIDGAVRRVVKR